MRKAAAAKEVRNREHPERTGLMIHINFPHFIRQVSSNSGRRNQSNKP